MPYFLRSLPYNYPEELVYLWSPNPKFKGALQELGPNVPDFYEWQRLSHGFQFGSDPHAIGKQIQLNRERYTVIGIMPKDFGYPLRGDIPYGHQQLGESSFGACRWTSA